MTQHDDEAYLRHMLDAAQEIGALTANLTYQAFTSDRVTLLATLHLLQTIGEAAGRLTAETKQGYPDVPWAQLRGMRNRIVHDYLGIDAEIIWTVIGTNIAELRLQLEAGIGSEPQSDPS